MPVIKPTVGRVVWFYNAPGAPERAAIIAHVWSDTCINAAIITQDGQMYPQPPTSIPLIQDGTPLPTAGYYCTWMPFQVGQAAKAEAAAAPSASAK